MEQLATQALELSPLGIAALALFVSLALLRKLSNGNNSKISKQIEEMRGNDLHSLEGMMHDLHYKTDKLISSNQEQIYILKDIKNLLQKKS